MNDEKKGEFYLHENGDLIYKPQGGVDAESPFVKKIWFEENVSETPETFFDFLQEAMDAGARHSRVESIAKHSGILEFKPNTLEALGLK